MKSMRVIGAIGLLATLSTSSFADGLSLVGAQIAQAYNVDAQQKSYQMDLQHNEQIEKERLEIERRIAQSDAEHKLQNGDSSMSANNDFDYRVLPSRCMKNDLPEFMCNAGNDNYYKVTKLSDGYRWTGFNTPKNMSWSGQLTRQSERTVYSGTDANGKAFRKTCSASACFE